MSFITKLSQNFKFMELSAFILFPVDVVLVVAVLIVLPEVVDPIRKF